MFKLSKDLIIFDVETSGSDTRTACIIQLGAVKMHKNGELCLQPSFELNVIPYTDTWEKEAEKIHGLSKADLMRTGYRRVEVLKNFEEWAGDPKKFYLAQWSCGFDTDMLRGAYESTLAMKYPYSHRVFDVASIVRFYLATKGKLASKCGEAECAKRLGIPVDKSQCHDALYDATLSGQMLEKIIREERKGKV
ncbi:MAG: 3'-5' exonuclease [Gallionella sp.]|jgi:DNA polymerase III epsilon subunit-like protein